MHPDLIANENRNSLLASFKRKIFKASSVHKSNDSVALDMSMDDSEYVLEEKDENALNLRMSNEASIEISVQICSDTIRQSLTEQARQSQIKMSLFDDITTAEFDAEAALVAFGDSSDIEKNLCFLWAAFNKKCDLFETLIKVGADSNFQDAEGLSAIHISAFVGCLTGTLFLILNGADLNAIGKDFTPLHYAVFGNQTDVVELLIKKGAIVNTVKCEETPLHCAIRANSPECLKLLLAEKVNVNSTEPCGYNALHLAAELGMTMCLEVLLDTKNVDINAKTCTKSKEMTALHIAADESNLDCVNLLLTKGADVRATNNRGASPLHLAAKCFSIECVEALLKNGRADPNAEDCDKRTPLHAAIGKSDVSFDLIEMMIKQGAAINHKDQYGFTPLHLAALDGVSDCVELLIFHGADVTTKVKNGNSTLNVILRKTPSSIDMVSQKLNTAITLHNVHDSSNKGDVELKLDFRQISHRYHPFEMKYLNAFVEDGKKEILLHPLCSAFLYLKWEKIRKYFIARFLFYLIFVSILTLYIFSLLINFPIITKETGLHSNTSYIKRMLVIETGNYNPIYLQWWVLFVFALVEISYKCYGFVGYNSIKQYVSHPENVIESMVILSVFIVSHLYYEDHKARAWQIHIGALAVLGGWTNLMLMIGQLPVFGSYVAMYQKVQKEFAKLFLAYSCILIGFSFSFAIIFSKEKLFSDPFMSFITMSTLMIGELSIDNFFDENISDQSFFLLFTSQTIYILFVFFVTVVLMNLLVGIAVHDIQGLRSTAELSKLVRQTKLMSKIESALIRPFWPKYIAKILYTSALISPRAYRVVISVKPLNPSEKRLPQDIMLAAYDLAKKPSPYYHSTSARKSKMSLYLHKIENVSRDYMFDYQPSTQTPVEINSGMMDEIANLKHLVKMQHDMLQTIMSKLDRLGDSTNC